MESSREVPSIASLSSSASKTDERSGSFASTPAPKESFPSVAYIYQVQQNMEDIDAICIEEEERLRLQAKTIRVSLQILLKILEENKGLSVPTMRDIQRKINALSKVEGALQVSLNLLSQRRSDMNNIGKQITDIDLS